LSVLSPFESVSESVFLCKPVLGCSRALTNMHSRAHTHTLLRPRRTWRTVLTVAAGCLTGPKDAHWRTSVDVRATPWLWAGCSKCSGLQADRVPVIFGTASSGLSLSLWSPFGNSHSSGLASTNELLSQSVCLSARRPDRNTFTPSLASLDSSGPLFFFWPIVLADFSLPAGAKVSRARLRYCCY